ncbi:MAG: tRNA pseudouridine(55) synthase TruB [Bacteroidia bacterium]|jgi:tRNA pseudouridine55 synthase
MSAENLPSPYHEGKILLLDKPLGWTSFDLVNKVRNSIRRKYNLKGKGIKVGHAGTLDPLATGLMIICTGRMTKQIDQFSGLDKAYSGTIVLGASTPSFDLEKEIDTRYPTEHITEDAVRETVRQFLGWQDQVPPLFSAKKIDGKRAYEFARKGEEVEIKTARIEIKSFEVTRIEMPEVDFIIHCSKGTYIRSIARDFGLALDSGAYLTNLRRTSIGKMDIKEAADVQEFLRLLQ